MVRPLVLERVAAPELDRVERQCRCGLVDQHLQRRHRLQRAVAAHRARGHAARMQRDRGDVDLRNVVDADARRSAADGRDVGRIVGEAAAIQDVIGGEGADLAGRAVDADPRAHLEGVTLDAALELLIAVVGEPHRPAGKEHRRQRNIERERRMVAPAEAAAHIGELRVDARRLEGRARLAEHEGDGLGGLVRRLHAEHELELACCRRSNQARPPSGSRNIGSTDCVSNSRSSTRSVRDPWRRARRGSARRRSAPWRRLAGVCLASGDQTGSAEFWMRAGLTQPAWIGE